MRIAQRNIPDYDDMTENEQKKAMRSLLRVRMDREQLLSIDFVFFPSLTHIYLGHNKLSFLPQLPVNLCFLVLNNNLFAKMAGIQHLKKLQLLDVSSNQLDEFVPSDYPKSLEYLIMEGNKCSKLADYRLNITYHFPNIQEIDQIPPSRLEKRLAFQAFGTIDEITASLESDDSEIEEDIKYDDGHVYDNVIKDILARSRHRQLQVNIATATKRQIPKMEQSGKEVFDKLNISG